MTIQTILRAFPDQGTCLNFIEKIRWDGQISCPSCHGTQITLRTEKHRHHCNTCNYNFSVIAGTVFENTKISLQTWFFAISLILNAKKGIPSRQLARDLGVNHKTAWYLQMRVRAIMTIGNPLLSNLSASIPEAIAKPESTKSRKSLPKLIQRGRFLAHFLELEYGKIVRLPFFPIGEPEKLKRQENLEIMNHIKCTKPDFRNQYLKQLFTKIPGKGFWTSLPRGLAGQYHRLSAKYFHAYLDELSFKRVFQHEESAFLELICRMAKRDSAN